MYRLSSGLVALLALFDSAGSLPTNSTDSSVKVSWIDGAPKYSTGTTFGVPWPQGKYDPDETSFSISGGNEDLPLQSWVTGYWRDGSVKWTGHALPAIEDAAEEYTVKASPKSKTTRRNSGGDLYVKTSSSAVTVDTGKITVAFPKKGSSLIESIKTAGGKTVGKNGKLVLHTQSTIADDVASHTNTTVDYFNFESNIEEVSVSEDSSVRALVTVRGKYQVTSGGKHDDWLPFVLRFYLYSGSEAIRIVHSIVFDGKADKDFISGLGIRFEVPLKGEELYNRHVRVAGVEGGFLNEAVQGITGLRRDPGEKIRTAQYEGKETPNITTWDERVSSRMQWIPAWNDFSLRQLTADGFTLKKRTKAGQSWLDVPSGTRSGGLAYLGGATQGGLAVALRNFWKQFPTGLDISNAASDSGEITLWLYSPEAQPLDLRPYHDLMGLDTYDDQLDALEITYEDYEPDFDTPYGIAKTHEIFVYAFDSTPSSEHLATLNNHTNEPPVLYADPAHTRETKALGTYWDLPDTSDQKGSTIEEHLDFLNKYYQGQIEDRRWYGFLHFGDFQHTYDVDRHTWRYDIGGYAWDNSELSPDLFFWQYFLRTGRADVYRFAEALTRHTGEVDAYHIGDWKGLGTRHGVLHFADSAKQARITQPQYRKYFYYVSGGDERVGEILEEMLDTDKTYGVLDPQRKVRTDGWKPAPGKPTAFSLGTDWAALAAGWLIEWERRGSRWEEAREKLTNTAAGIANLTNGFVTGSGLYDIEGPALLPPPEDEDNKGLVAVSHLNAVFGMPEVISEALEYWGDDAPKNFKKTWLDYCFYYGATADEQEARYGEAFSDQTLLQGHSRLTAYYYSQKSNNTVGKRVWDEFYNYDQADGIKYNATWKSQTISGPGVLIPVEETDWITTNDVAQFGLAAIQDLAWAKKALDSYTPGPDNVA